MSKSGPFRSLAVDAIVVVNTSLKDEVENAIWIKRHQVYGEPHYIEMALMSDMVWESAE